MGPIDSVIVSEQVGVGIASDETQQPATEQRPAVNETAPVSEVLTIALGEGRS